MRAKGCYEDCGRPHGEIVRHLGDGRWWDEARQTWRDGRGREIPCPALAEEQPMPDDQGGAGGGASRPRPRALRPAAPQRQGALPAVPPAPRPARASPAHPAHPAPASGPGRPVLGHLSGLTNGTDALVVLSRSSHRHPPGNPLPCGEAGQPSAAEVSLLVACPHTITPVAGSARTPAVRERAPSI